jgi:hypothetical protein
MYKKAIKMPRASKKVVVIEDQPELDADEPIIKHDDKEEKPKKTIAKKEDHKDVNEVKSHDIAKTEEKDDDKKKKIVNKKVIKMETEIKESDDEPGEETKKVTKKKVIKTEINESNVKNKSEKDEKPKRVRKASAYNILIGEFMKKISLEEKDKPKEEQIPYTDRMKVAQVMYKEWKEAHPPPEVKTDA